MNKLQMAHEYAMKHVQEGFDINYDVLVVEAWKYADAMQAEADKRNYSEKQDSSEWQPDWSQAPRCDVVAWDINEHGQGRWIASDNGYYLAPSFGYQGNWQDSLRKRPQ